MTQKPETNPDAELGYEEARQLLVDVVAKLEAGAPLEESLALWERGEELATLCRARLEHARQRIEARTTSEGPGDQAKASGATAEKTADKSDDKTG